MSNYDAIILGTGGVGSAALLHLAARGHRVLGIERFALGHNRGSSHGESRVIRKAYFEHADYVPLLDRAYELWGELETRTGRQLLHRVGLLEVGPPEGIVIPGVLHSAKLHNLAVETLTPEQSRRRFPGFAIPNNCDVIFEPEAGYLLVEACVLAHVQAAVEQGAVIHCGESMQSFSATRDSVEVATDRGRYSAARLIITAGAWAGELLADLGIALRVLRKQVHWYPTTARAYSAAAHCPTYLFELPQGVFYGFPEIHGATVKVGEHTGGAPVTDLLNDDREVDLQDCQRVAAFLAACLPGVSRSPCAYQTCYYTLSPDEHFLVDRHPVHPSICFAAGLSGHGFKFTPVLGEILADLAESDETKWPIEFLRLGRF